MWRSFRDPPYRQYSPFFTGFTLTVFIALEFLLIETLGGIPIPQELWFLSLGVLLVGLVLQLLSKRVLWIRIYQTFTTLLVVLVYVSALWLILTYHRTWESKLVTGALLVFTLSGSVVTIYWTTKNKNNLAMMPYGPTGLLNHKTGSLDPSRSPAVSQAKYERSQHSASAVQQFTPLIAGGTMLLVKVLPESGVTIMMALVALCWVILGLMGTFQFARYTFSIIRWEREHGKRIYVMGR